MESDAHALTFTFLLSPSDWRRRRRTPKDPSRAACPEDGARLLGPCQVEKSSFTCSGRVEGSVEGRFSSVLVQISFGSVQCWFSSVSVQIYSVQFSSVQSNGSSVSVYV